MKAIKPILMIGATIATMTAITLAAAIGLNMVVYSLMDEEVEVANLKTKANEVLLTDRSNSF